MRPRSLLQSVPGPEASPRSATTYVSAKVLFFNRDIGQRFGKVEIPDVGEVYFRFADIAKLEENSLRPFKDGEECILPCPGDIVFLALHAYTDGNEEVHHAVRQWALEKRASTSRRIRSRLRVVVQEQSAHP